MTKKMWSLLLTGALIAGVFSAVPAQAAPEVPASPNIVDPAGDGNAINDAVLVPLGKDNVTPADATTIGDLLAVWFSNDASKVSTHIQVELPPPGGNGIAYNVFASPGEGEAGSNTVGCLRFFLILPGSNPGGGTFQGQPMAKLLDRCNTGGTIYDAPDAEYLVEELGDGTGVVTITAPLDVSPLLADGQSLLAPTATSHSPAIGQTTGPRETWVISAQPTIDNTKVGADYALTSGGAPTAPPVVQEPPGKNDPPGQGNQNCAKIKDKKKKKACKKNSGKTPPGNECAAYTPGEQGAEAELITVTSAATAEAPIETPVSMGPAVGLFTGDLPGIGPNPATTQTFYNFQVDSDKTSDGLFIRLDFGVEEDYDIYLNNADGTEAAHVGGFNSAPVAQAGTDGTGNGGHSEQGAEQLDGVLTPDCGGYTLKIANAFGFGEPVMTAWLGDATWDPAGQAAIPAKAYVL